jgi:hypothetical protein
MAKSTVSLPLNSDHIGLIIYLLLLLFLLYLYNISLGTSNL